MPAPMKTILWRVASWTMLVAFLFSIVVQFNDPDTGRWVAIYGAAALACVFDMQHRGHWSVPALIGVAAVAWSATYAHRVVGHVRFLDMFGAFEMKSLPIEESREMYGLLIIAAWMAVLVWRGLPFRR